MTDPFDYSVSDTVLPLYHGTKKHELSKCNTFQHPRDLSHRRYSPRINYTNRGHTAQDEGDDDGDGRYQVSFSTLDGIGSSNSSCSGSHRSHAAYNQHSYAPTVQPDVLQAARMAHYLTSPPDGYRHSTDDVADDDDHDEDNHDEDDHDDDDDDGDGDDDDDVDDDDDDDDDDDEDNVRPAREEDFNSSKLHASEDPSCMICAGASHPSLHTASSSAHHIQGPYWRVAAILMWVGLLALLYMVEIITGVIAMATVGSGGLLAQCVIGLSLIIFPAMLVSVLSMGLYKRDDAYYTALDVKYSKRVNWSSLLMHCFLLGTIHRLYKVGVVSPLSHTQFYQHIKKDTDLIRYILAMLHTMPQLTLYLHLALKYQTAGTDMPVAVTVAAIFSTISALFVIGSFAANDLLSTRDATQSVGAKVVVFLWHTATCAARIIAFAAFSSHFDEFVFVVVFVHSVFMWIWVFSQRPSLGDNPNSESVENDEQSENRSQNAPFRFSHFVVKVFWGYYYTLAGLVQLFVFYNIKSGRTRFRLAFYCTLAAFENVLLVFLYHFFTPVWPSTLVLSGEISLVVLAITLMLTYYLVWHPRLTQMWGRFNSRWGIPPYCTCCHGSATLYKDAERPSPTKGASRRFNSASGPHIQDGRSSPTLQKVYGESIQGLINQDFSHYLAQMSITSASIDRITSDQNLDESSDQLAAVGSTEQHFDSSAEMLPDRGMGQCEENSIARFVDSVVNGQIMLSPRLDMYRSMDHGKDREEEEDDDDSNDNDDGDDDSGDGHENKEKVGESIPLHPVYPSHGQNILAHNLTSGHFVHTENGSFTTLNSPPRSQRVGPQLSVLVHLDSSKNGSVQPSVQMNTSNAKPQYSSKSNSLRPSASQRASELAFKEGYFRGQEDKRRSKSTGQYDRSWDNVPHGVYTGSHRALYGGHDAYHSPRSTQHGANSPSLNTRSGALPVGSGEPRQPPVARVSSRPPVTGFGSLDRTSGRHRPRVVSSLEVQSRRPQFTSASAISSSGFDGSQHCVQQLWEPSGANRILSPDRHRAVLLGESISGARSHPYASHNRISSYPNPVSTTDETDMASLAGTKASSDEDIRGSSDSVVLYKMSMLERGLSGREGGVTSSNHVPGDQTLSDEGSTPSSPGIPESIPPPPYYAEDTMVTMDTSAVDRNEVLV